MDSGKTLLLVISAVLLAVVALLLVQKSLSVTVSAPATGQTPSATTLVARPSTSPQTITPDYRLVATLRFCVGQGSFDYCGRFDWGYSSQWLSNGKASQIRLAEAREAGTANQIGAVYFDRVEIHLRTWACYTDAWAKLTVDNIQLVSKAAGQTITLDDMEGQVTQRWAKQEHVYGGSVRGGSLSAPLSANGSQALQVTLPSGVDAYCAGARAVRVFDLPSTLSTADVALSLLSVVDGQGAYHEGFVEVFLYRKL